MSTFTAKFLSISCSYAKYTCNTVTFCFPILNLLTYKPSSGVFTLLPLLCSIPPANTHTLGIDAS